MDFEKTHSHIGETIEGLNKHLELLDQKKKFFDEKKEAYKLSDTVCEITQKESEEAEKRLKIYTAILENISKISKLPNEDQILLDNLHTFCVEHKLFKDENYIVTWLALRYEYILENMKHVDGISNILNDEEMNVKDKCLFICEMYKTSPPNILE